MKHISLIIIFLTASFFAYSQGLMWAKQFNGTGQNQPISIVQDNAGNYYVLGNFNGTVTQDAITLNTYGVQDIFLSKYDPQGVVQWIKQIGGTGTETAIGLAINHVGTALFISGQTNGSCSFDGYSFSTSGLNDVFLAKYALDGTCQWAHNIAYGTTQQINGAIAVDDNENIIMAGVFIDNVTFYGGVATLTSLYSGVRQNFVAKFDQDGNYSWSKVINCDDATTSTNIKAVSTYNNEYFFSGQYIGNVDIEGNIISNATAMSDGIIFKLNNSGNFQWVKKMIGADNTEYIYKQINGESGNLYLAGYYLSSQLNIDGTILNNTTSGKSDIVIFKYNTNGILQWAKNIGSTGDDRLLDIHVSNNHVVLTGSYGGTIIFGNDTLLNSGGTDAFMAECDASGNFIKAIKATGTGNDLGEACFINKSGRNYIATGDFYSPTLTIGSNQFTNSVQNLSTRDAYIIRYGCFDSLHFVVTPVSCIDAMGFPLVDDGAIVVTPSVGNEPYTYHWSNNASSSTISNLGLGPFSVTVTGTNGCTLVGSAMVGNKPILQASITNVVNILCGGTNSGSATVTATLGNAPYTYLWSNSATTPTITNVAAGTYYVTVTDQCGNTVLCSANITQPATLTATITAQTNVSCNGGSNGSATVTAGGGTTPYTYLWNDPAPAQTTPTCNALTAGNWSVTITDANGCTVTKSVTITQPAVLTSSIIAKNNVSCNGGSNGSATVGPIGGTSPYTYLWNDPAPAQTTATCTTLTAGTWTVTVTDNKGCTTTSSVTITQPTALTASISSQANVSCNNGANGSATVTAAGGTPGYTYLWNDPAPAQTTVTCTALTAGTWTVTVTDNNSCTTTSSVTITQPTTVTAGITAQTNVSCNGGSNGSATSQAYGGANPTQYIWNDPALQTTKTATGLIAGVWSVTVTRSAGCAVATVTITQPTTVTAAITAQTNVSCNGGANGTATVTATGGSGTSTYVWSDPFPAQTTQTATALTAGTWSVTVTKTGGCAIASVTITQPTIVTATITSQTNVSCNGGSNGSATVTVSGGTPSYTYLWNDPAPAQTTATCSALTAGTWRVTVTDLNGCTLTRSVTITQPTVLTATISAKTNVSCNGGSNGTATVTVGGGTTPYSYLWNDPAPAQTTAVCTALTAGIWTVTVTDNNSCTKTANVTITQPTALTSSIIAKSDVTCNNGSNGSATVGPVGGTTPYTYLWNDPAPAQTTATCSALSAGTWNVTVTDINSCTTMSIVTITQPSTVTATISSHSDVSCNGGANGKATVTATGGSGTPTYVWNDPAPVQMTQTATALTAGTWSVTVTKTGGCAVATVTITQPAALTITSSTTCSAAFPGCNGTATATVSGGTSPYNYLWNNNSQTTQTAVNLCPNRYRVTVTDANGCTKTKTRIRVSTCAKSLGTEQIITENINKISVYPNPVSSQLSILVENEEKTDENTIVSVEIFNLLGELISKENKQATYGYPVYKDITSFTPGVYLVSITDGTNYFSQRILIQK